MKRFYEAGKLDKRFITGYCLGDWQSCVRYRKEEAGIMHPDNLRQDGVIDEKLR